MSGIGSVRGPRRDFGSADTAELSDVAAKLEAPHARSRSDDLAGPLKALSTRLARDGKLDKADAEAIIRQASAGGTSEAERAQLVSLLRTQGAKITPAALEVI